jgi:peptidyl-prolyl cis-trans isomerase D
MLRWLRRYSKSWFIALAIGAIVVVFIFWGVGGLRSPRFQEVAEVNGTPILLTAYMKYYNDMLKDYQQRAKGELTEEMVKSMRLKETALNQLIGEALLLQAAQRLGIRVTDSELREQIIRAYPFFLEDGKFNERRYTMMLSRAHFTPGDFEDQERRRLLSQKVIQEVSSFAKISDAELLEMELLVKEAVAVKYLVVSPEPFMARQHPKEAEISQYYQEHQAEFRQPARVKVSYLMFRNKDFLERVKVSPTEVDDYLKEHAQEFTQPSVIRVSQMLLTVPAQATPAQRQEVEKKAQELLEKVRAGEDFAGLARSHSQDAASRDKGGDLGDIKKGQHPAEWERVAFALKPGEAGLTPTPQGIYLIKLEEVKETERVPNAVEQVTLRLKEEKARRLAREAARKAQAELARASVAEVAATYKVTPKETPLFSLKDPIPELGLQPVFNQAALKLKPGEVSLVDLVGSFAVLKGMEHQPEELPPLEKIKDQVREACKKAQAAKEAQQEATRLLERLRKGEPLSQVATQAGLPLKETDFFTRFQGFMNQPRTEDLTSEAFQLSSQRPYPAKPVLWQDRYYLLAFKARRSPEEAELQKELPKIRVNVLEHKKQLLFTAWLEGERKRAKIKIFELP